MTLMRGSFSAQASHIAGQRSGLPSSTRYLKISVGLADDAFNAGVKVALHLIDRDNDADSRHGKLLFVGRRLPPCFQIARKHRQADVQGGSAQLQRCCTLLRRQCVIDTAQLPLGFGKLRPVAGLCQVVGALIAVQEERRIGQRPLGAVVPACLLYTSDAADE